MSTKAVRRLSETSAENSTIPTTLTGNTYQSATARRRSLRARPSDSDIPALSSLSGEVHSTKAAMSAAVDGHEQKQQARNVGVLRAAVICTLVVATVIVASLTYFFVHNGETANFNDQYEDSVSKVAEAFQHRIDVKHDAASTFSALYTSRYGNNVQPTPVWPNVTMPYFEQQAEGELSLADGRAISFNPIITQDVNRLLWEAFAVQTADLLGSDTLITPAPNTTWPDNRTVAFGIYSRDPLTKDVRYDTGNDTQSRYPYVLVPVWQIAPIANNSKAVMFNLHSEPNRQRALDDMLAYRVPTLTAILQLVQDGEILRPSAILFYPVFDAFYDDIPIVNQTVAGSISVVFSWDTLLASILPNYIKGMICVLSSSINQTYTYSISGDTVTLLGKGDSHDTKYDSMGQTVQANLENTKQLLGDVKYLITYQLTMYPSQEFEDQYVTQRAAIYTSVVVLIFVFTAGLFLLYDYLVEDRQQRTEEVARQTSTIVDSMFPATFRDRLYKSQRRSSTNSELGRRYSDSTVRAANSTPPYERRSSGEEKKQGGIPMDESEKVIKRNSYSSGRKSVSSHIGGKVTLKKIDKFMKNVRSAPSDHEVVTNGQEDEPIADLFLDTSIMFSDIVGFTKWSSERSPNEVFTLLERLFWEFDVLADMHNVFKLGTIGDCYIAVTGIPDPIDDYATVLTQFAFDCRDKVRQVCTDLDAEGLDTAKLDMRFGIHSGAITAGILRGTKSRFELFGDTINTASRMESTGRAGKIQVSEETAELLRLDGKDSWLAKREDMVTAKGKGQLQTYWAEPGGESDPIFSVGRLESLTEENVRNASGGSDGYETPKYYNLEYSSRSEVEEIDSSTFNITADVKSVGMQDPPHMGKSEVLRRGRTPSEESV